VRNNKVRVHAHLLDDNSSLRCRQPVWIAIAGKVAIAAGLPILLEPRGQGRCPHRSRHRQFRRGYRDRVSGRPKPRVIFR
jgi:hypothetical protein